MKIENYQEVWNIWLSSKDQLHRYMVSRFKDEELAKDITQEVLLKKDGVEVKVGHGMVNRR